MKIAIFKHIFSNSLIILKILNENGITLTNSNLTGNAGSFSRVCIVEFCNLNSRFR